MTGFERKDLIYKSNPISEVASVRTFYFFYFFIHYSSAGYTYGEAKKDNGRLVGDICYSLSRYFPHVLRFKALLRQ